MEVRINGQTAAIGAAAGVSLTGIVGAVRTWAEKAGRTISSLVLDGEELTPREIDLREREGRGAPPTLLEIHTLDRSRLGLHAVRRAAALLPGLRMDLGLASLSIHRGDLRAGLDSLHRAVSSLGAVEAAVGNLGRGSPAHPGADVETDPAMAGLRDLLGIVRSSIRTRDLDALAAVIGTEGPRVISDLADLIARIMHRAGRAGEA